jgi:hypothetical protein
MNSMNLIELGRITSDERESFRYLCDKFIDLSCPNCNASSMLLYVETEAAMQDLRQGF